MGVRVQPRSWRIKMMASQYAILLPVICFLRLWFGSEFLYVRDNYLADNDNKYLG